MKEERALLCCPQLALCCGELLVVVIVTAEVISKKICSAKIIKLKTLHCNIKKIGDKLSTFKLT